MITEPRKTFAVFLDDPPPRDALDDARGRSDEEIQLGNREIDIHYARGAGQSKLKRPAAEAGTARNMNTVARLVEIRSEG